MATTFIEYKDDKGFYIPEVYMELTYDYILQALKQRTDKIAFKEDLKKDLKLFSSSILSGLFTMTWSSFVKTSDDEQIILSILKDTKILLESKGDVISTKELNGYESKKRVNATIWPKPMKTSEVIKIVDALILMFKGEWESTNYDMNIDYWFG